VTGSLPSFYQLLLGASGGSLPGLGPAVALSLLLGAVHAASPGHGKTLVVASLLGSRGSLGQALLLAVTVAVTHTAGVLLLALIVVTANDALLPQQLTPFISLGAAILVVLFGADLARRALRARAGLSTAGSEHDHVHAHAPIAVDGPGHGLGGADSHGHQHAGIELSRGYTLSVGVIGGLVPNATALLVLVMAITFRELLLGLLLVVMFGLGIAVVLASVGVGTVVVRRRSGPITVSHRTLGRALNVLPLLSGLAVVVVGLALTLQALGAVSAL
jgi:nickel/cobalt transporter (NicO) family protein